MSYKVLVCDDAMFMRATVTQILHDAGHEVVGEATNGLQAVEKYKQLRPDLVTMDIVMPEASGMEAIRGIMAVDPEARVIICSAVGQRKLIEQAIDEGAKAFVVKPFEPSQLLDAVDQAFS